MRSLGYINDQEGPDLLEKRRAIFTRDVCCAESAAHDRASLEKKQHWKVS